MRRKWVWLFVSCLVGAALVLVSCGPAEEEEEAEEEVAEEEVAEEEEEEVAEEEEVSEETGMPEYGGEVTVIMPTDPKSFDDTFGSSAKHWSLSLTNEDLLQGDWTRGPAGTNELTWTHQPGFEGVVEYSKTGRGLCESWDIDRETNTLTFHIRDGVYWALHPGSEASELVNGRQLVADDVASSINRQFTNPMSFLLGSYWKPLSVTAPDDLTVVMEFDTFNDLAQDFGELVLRVMIYPHEVVEKYGDMRDWRNSVGSGPFILTDYIQGASLTHVRNDNYWDTDPIGLGKGNQLPYLDGVKVLIIPDVSTQEAAIRTGKADQCRFNWDMATTLLKTSPELKWVKNIYNSASGVCMRLDNAEFPWTDINVRHALMMAIDYPALVDDYYAGEAEWYSYPTTPGPEYEPLRVPFEDLPQNVQDLFKYQPDKAKQLLADAGYADGFDMNIVINVADSDLVSILKEYWAKIGVNLIIDPKEWAVYQSIWVGRTHEEAILSSMQTVLPFNMDSVRDWKTSMFNRSFVQDDHCDEVHREIWDNYFDYEKQCEIFKEITPYMLENCWYVPVPTYNYYIFWQPWVKNYHGEYSLGNNVDPNWCKWVWLDQNLKAEMTR